MLTFIALALATSAAPAIAGTFSPPEGCTAYVTVQHASCQVSHHYTCDGDPKGDQWAVYAGADGPYYMSRIDAETRWLESFDLIAGESDNLAREPDPASFTTLLQTGRDDYDFNTESSTGEMRRYAGYDKLAGGMVTIDGVTLERTEFMLKSYGADGSLLHQRKGRQLISRDWRIFFADQEDFENGAGDKEHTIDTPMTFAFPGEAGFLTDKPQFGCDQMMTRNQLLDAIPASYAAPAGPEAAP